MNWYILSDVFMHLTMYRNWYSNVTDLPVQNIRIVDNKVFKVECCGKASLQVMINNSNIETIQVKNVLYVPKLSTNLLLVSKIIKSDCTLYSHLYLMRMSARF